MPAEYTPRDALIHTRESLRNTLDWVHEHLADQYGLEWIDGEEYLPGPLNEVMAALYSIVDDVTAMGLWTPGSITTKMMVPSCALSTTPTTAPCTPSDSQRPWESSLNAPTWSTPTGNHTPWWRQRPGAPGCMLKVVTAMSNAPTVQVGALLEVADNPSQSTYSTPCNNHTSIDSLLREPQGAPGFNELVLETTLLRGLLSYPAVKVVAVTDLLVEEDLYDTHHRVIYRAIVKRAMALVTSGQGAASVDPVAVQLELQNTGELSHGSTASVLIEAVTGNPPAWVDLHAIATGCKVRRLRKACADIGNSLIAMGADGSIDELVKAIADTYHLTILAERAGLEVSSHGC